MNKPSETIWVSNLLVEDSYENFSVKDLIDLCAKNNISDIENVNIYADDSGRIDILYEKEIENPDYEKEMNAYYAFHNLSKEQELERKHKAKAKQESLLAKKQYKE